MGAGGLYIRLETRGGVLTVLSGSRFLFKPYCTLHCQLGSPWGEGADGQARVMNPLGFHFSTSWRWFLNWILNLMANWGSEWSRGQVWAWTSDFLGMHPSFTTYRLHDLHFTSLDLGCSHLQNGISKNDDCLRQVWGLKKWLPLKNLALFSVWHPVGAQKVFVSWMNIVHALA